MTAAEERSLERSQPVLKSRHLGVWCQAVLGEIQRSARLQHAVDLGEHLCRVGHGAHRPGAENMVHAAVGRRERSGVESRELDRHRTRGDAVSGDLPPGDRRIDNPDPGHRGRVVGEIQSGSEADLQHLAVEVGSNPGPDRPELGTAHREVDNAGEHPVGVPAHPPQSGTGARLLGRACYTWQVTIEGLQRQYREFVADRDWEQFHAPKNLVMALTGEVGELTEIFQWLTAEESQAIMADEGRAAQVRDELADVFAYLIRLADVLGVDLERAFIDKMIKNARKYPVETSAGSAAKYKDPSPP